jgi:hypothetical protein
MKFLWYLFLFVLVVVCSALLSCVFAFSMTKEDLLQQLLGKKNPYLNPDSEND